MAEENNEKNNNSEEEESQLPKWVQFVYEELEKHKKSKNAPESVESAKGWLFL